MRLDLFRQIRFSSKHYSIGLRAYHHLVSYFVTKLLCVSREAMTWVNKCKWCQSCLSISSP